MKDEGYAKERFWAAGGFGRHETPQAWDEQLAHQTRPVVGVSWYEVSAYAAWASCRLPTEAEWERAARGLEGRRFPWEGDEEPTPRLANYDGSRIGHPTSVGVYPLGQTPEGVRDMAGNVWEWCSDWYGRYSPDPQENPGGPHSGDARVLRGGAWLFGGIYLRCSYRSWISPASRDGFVGFRLAAGT